MDLLRDTNNNQVTDSNNHNMFSKHPQERVVAAVVVVLLPVLQLCAVAALQRRDAKPAPTVLIVLRDAAKQTIPDGLVLARE